MRPTQRWWKGNLHTHSLWSDGDDFPEMIASWYRDHGYHFLALSDHNILSVGQKWVDVSRLRSAAVLSRYQARFGRDWVETRVREGKRQVRLKPLEEFRPLLEESGRFLMIPSEEITSNYDRIPVHLNATNIRELIPAQTGSSVQEVMQKSVDAVLEQRRRTGQPMFPHLNHPNFGWAITAEELAAVRGERFFEVYNGHPTVHNSGDELHADTDRIWDIILTMRLARLGLDLLYGVAVDDSHNYHQQAPRLSNSGRGWVMVRAPHLTPEQIVHAMERGEFYASNGVTLRDVRRERNRLTVEVEPEAGVEYRIMFLGTRVGVEPNGTPVTGPDGKPLRVTRRYPPGIGAVLQESRGVQATYTLRGDELYVRAKVVSSKAQAHPNPEGGYQTAWVQPIRP